MRFPFRRGSAPIGRPLPPYAPVARLEDELGELPPAPRNVRIQAADGTVHPVELTYDGQDATGTHVWTAVNAVPLPTGEHMLLIESLPARTTVLVALS